MIHQNTYEKYVCKWQKQIECCSHDLRNHQTRINEWSQVDRSNGITVTHIRLFGKTKNHGRRTLREVYQFNSQPVLLIFSYSFDWDFIIHETVFFGVWLIMVCYILYPILSQLDGLRINMQPFFSLGGKSFTGMCWYWLTIIIVES